eukprot:612871-Lingulodinium_polyedra.AAC.1
MNHAPRAVRARLAAREQRETARAEHVEQNTEMHGGIAGARRALARCRCIAFARAAGMLRVKKRAAGHKLRWQRAGAPRADKRCNERDAVQPCRAYT